MKLVIDTNVSYICSKQMIYSIRRRYGNTKGFRENTGQAY